MTSVSDTSPILNLATIGEGALLEKIFGELAASTAVAQEILRLGSSSGRFAAIKLPSFIKVLPVQNTAFAEALKLQLHAGEAEAIALAVELKATRLLVDEHRARQVAARLGVPTIGCFGILLEAKRRGILTAIRPVLEKLEKQAGFWAGDALKATVLSAAGE